MTLLTVHVLIALPSHNLNRDESGAPKQITEGGVRRARLSSQSLKRAARVGFERTLAERERSLRTKVGVQVIVDRIAELRGGITDAQRAKLTAAVGKRVLSLTQDAPDEGAVSTKKDTMVWLSPGELEAAARTFAAGGDADVVGDATTDSLPIAAFGRMFANQPGLNIPAAVSVGDATTTHAAVIELDWFTAVDDGETSHGGAGQMGYQMHTSGVYYRSFTIDRDQLARNLGGGLDDPSLTEALLDFVRHLTLALPSGKQAGSAASTLPALILAEEQTHRVAYDFQKPVAADADGGFLQPSIQRLIAAADGAKAFAPSVFGARLTSGTANVDGLNLHSFDEYLAFALSYLRGNVAMPKA